MLYTMIVSPLAAGSLGVVYPIGAVIEGKLGDSIGLRTVAIGAAVLFAGIVTLVLGTRSARRALLDQAGPATPEPSVPAALA